MLKERSLTIKSLHLLREITTNSMWRLLERCTASGPWLSLLLCCRCWVGQTSLPLPNQLLLCLSACGSGLVYCSITSAVPSKYVLIFTTFWMDVGNQKLEPKRWKFWSEIWISDFKHVFGLFRFFYSGVRLRDYIQISGVWFGDRLN